MHKDLLLILSVPNLHSTKDQSLVKTTALQFEKLVGSCSVRNLQDAIDGFDHTDPAIRYKLVRVGSHATEAVIDVVDKGCGKLNDLVKAAHARMSMAAGPLRQQMNKILDDVGARGDSNLSAQDIESLIGLHGSSEAKEFNKSMKAMDTAWTLVEALLAMKAKMSKDDLVKNFLDVLEVMKEDWAGLMAIKHSMVVVQALFCPLTGGVEDCATRKKYVSRAHEILRSDYNPQSLGPRPKSGLMHPIMQDAFGKASQPAQLG